jgi:hypothetical protein
LSLKGKASEYTVMSAHCTKERRKLDSEIEQTAMLVAKKKAHLQKEEELKATIQEQNREFYCEICDKQYKTVGEMSNHLSSYDHHHKKRFDEMKKMQRGARSNDTQKKRQKEKKREEAEMRKRMQAAGVKMGAAPQKSKPRLAAPFAQPAKVPLLSFSLQDIVRFYEIHDKSKANEETAEYILDNFGSEEITQKMQERFGAAPTRSAPNTSALALSVPAPATSATSTGEECFTKQQLQEFYEIHDESKADEETAAYILENFGTDEITQKLIDQYGTAPTPKLVVKRTNNR